MLRQSARLETALKSLPRFYSTQALENQTTESVVEKCEEELTKQPLDDKENRPSEAFRYGELVLAKIYRDHSKLEEDYSCRMFVLKKNGIMANKYFSIFHEHILSQSAAAFSQTHSRDMLFRLCNPLKNERVKGI